MIRIRVFITDDHAVVRNGLRGILEGHSDIEVVGEAGNFHALMEGLKTHPADVLLIDVSMPGTNGIEALKTLAAEHPGLKALVVSMYGEDQFAFHALAAGAYGYLTKTAGPERLVEAVRTLAAGRKYLTPEVSSALADRSGAPIAAGALPHDVLSERELQTLRLIASGRKLSAIAQEMAISAKTVSVYRARLLEKMRMKSSAELTRYALEHRLLD